MSEPGKSTGYIGRFAPSPTGDLHFGSLVSAVASYLQARRSGGQWLVRIEDIDPPREVSGSAASIIEDLERFGMNTDRPVLYQSTRMEAYERACKRLLDGGMAYWCGCSRKDLPPGGVYPGTCRDGLSAGKSPRSIRLRVAGACIRFTDLVQGPLEEAPERTSGDFVIFRADGLPAYQLAVVVDDAHQGVTEVVRGADLLDSTARQIQLQRNLALPRPDYAHHPVAVQENGTKLSKRHRSDPVSNKQPVEAIRLALEFLGQTPPCGLRLDQLWSWALENWQLKQVPRCQEIKLA
jgi:glutamyl-Q tRNA(Asp) synthetase